MVKRKTGFDQVEKVARRPKTGKKPKGVNFDDMESVVRDGRLLVGKGDTVYFMRNTETGPILCVGTIHTVYEGGQNDGGVDVWDETKEMFFLFNYKRGMHLVDVRCDGLNDALRAIIGPLDTVKTYDAPAVFPEGFFSEPAPTDEYDEEPANPVAMDLGLEDGISEDTCAEDTQSQGCSDTVRTAGDVCGGPGDVRDDLGGVHDGQKPAKVDSNGATPGTRRWVRRVVPGVSEHDDTPPDGK